MLDFLIHLKLLFSCQLCSILCTSLSVTAQYKELWFVARVNVIILKIWPVKLQTGQENAFLLKKFPKIKMTQWIQKQEYVGNSMSTKI